jgi:hypothetical protein
MYFNIHIDTEFHLIYCFFNSTYILILNFNLHIATVIQLIFSLFNIQICLQFQHTILLWILYIHNQIQLIYWHWFSIYILILKFILYFDIESYIYIINFNIQFDCDSYILTIIIHIVTEFNLIYWYFNQTYTLTLEYTYILSISTYNFTLILIYWQSISTYISKLIQTFSFFNLKIHIDSESFILTIQCDIYMFTQPAG